MLFCFFSFLFELTDVILIFLLCINSGDGTLGASWLISRLGYTAEQAVHCTNSREGHRRQQQGDKEMILFMGKKGCTDLMIIHTVTVLLPIHK